MNTYDEFSVAIFDTRQMFLEKSQTIHTDTWQGIGIKNKPEMAMHEVLHYSLDVALDWENLDEYRNQIRPNLPWADDHFLERVSGEPLNPGVEWANWPYNKSAAEFRDSKGQFNHNYMERYWPRWAAMFTKGELPWRHQMDIAYDEHTGLRGRLGDLNDVISLLISDPLTRQAYMPIFFPEDTGNANPGRKPCTLGYHFIMRRGRMDITYYIRSCDFVRHFRDDIYLTVRLLLWVLDRLRERDLQWNTVVPGRFIMHITSLHMFRNDWLMLFGNARPPA
jgi:thymidylate synthase